MIKSGLLAVANRRSAVPTPDILWWKLNEGSGTSIAGSGSNGGDGGATDADWLTGKNGSGYALDFNGINDDANTSASITYGTDKLTFCGWFYFDDITSTQVIMESSANWNSSSDSFLIYLDAGAFFAGLRDNGAKYRVESITAPSVGSWVHLAVLLDFSSATGRDVKIYVNAVEQSTTISTNYSPIARTFAAYKLYVGARGGTSLFFNGRIDDLRIYTGDKSADLTAIMNDAQ